MHEHEILPSWRPGETRDAVLAFLDAARSVPVEQRVACFDNDGTLWCERPTYAQFDFFVDALKSAVQTNPALSEKPEFAALLLVTSRPSARSAWSRSRSPSQVSFTGSHPRSSRTESMTSFPKPCTPPSADRCAPTPTCRC